nr:MAG TPA: hypothetical protein [Bacteriophage sp.]
MADAAINSGRSARSSVSGYDEKSAAVLLRSALTNSFSFSGNKLIRATTACLSAIKSAKVCFGRFV